MNRTALTLLGLLAFSILAVWCLGHAGEIQDRLRDEVRARLAAAGLTGVEVSVDGLRVDLAGALPDEASRAEARRIAGAHPGAGRLDDRLTIGRPEGVRLVSRGGQLTLSGAFAAAAARGRVLEAAAVLWGERHDAGGLEVDPAAPAVQRLDALVSVIALLRDQPGSFDLGWGPPVDVEGEVASAEAKAAFLARLGALTAGWRIDERIRVAPRSTDDELARLLAERPVEFASGSARLSEGGEAVLDEAVRLLTGAPGARFAIEGHTDGQGGAGFNLELSRRRAAAVRDYLAGAGLDAGRFEAVGFGASRPVASNDTAEGRRRNRRVELRRLEEETP